MAELAALVEHHALFYDDMRDPVALLRGETVTRLGRFWPYAHDAGVGDSADPAACAAYSELMACSQQLIAEDVLAAYAEEIDALMAANVDQIVEAIEAHTALRGKAARAKAIDWRGLYKNPGVALT